MTSMIERVARAICKSAWKDDPFGNPSWEESSSDVKAAFLEDAKAAIAAMREPTDEMTRAGCDQWNNPAAGPHVSTMYGVEAVNIFRAMIDSILSESTET